MYNTWKGMFWLSYLCLVMSYEEQVVCGEYTEQDETSTRNAENVTILL